MSPENTATDATLRVAEMTARNDWFERVWTDCEYRFEFALSTLADLFEMEMEAQPQPMDRAWYADVLQLVERASHALRVAVAARMRSAQTACRLDAMSMAFIVDPDNEDGGRGGAIRAQIMQQWRSAVNLCLPAATSILAARQTQTKDDRLSSRIALLLREIENQVGAAFPTGVRVTDTDPRFHEPSERRATARFAPWQLGANAIARELYATGKAKQDTTKARLAQLVHKEMEVRLQTADGTMLLKRGETKLPSVATIARHGLIDWPYKPQA